jgi:hypothetical protein
MSDAYYIPLEPDELQAIRETAALADMELEAMIQQSLDPVIDPPPELPDIEAYDPETVLWRLWSIAETNPHVRQAVLEAIR